MAPVIGILIIWLSFILARWVIWPRFPSVPTALLAWTPVVAGPLVILGDSFNPGLLLIAFGGLSNATVVVANGGRFPADKEEKRLPRHYVPFSSQTRLRWLGDWIPLLNRERLFSPGDVSLVLGILVAVGFRLLERGWELNV